MSRATDKRVQRLVMAIEAMPLQPSVIKDAFTRFREHGELPETRRLAAAVVRQAKSGVVMTDDSGGEMNLVGQLHALRSVGNRPEDVVMSSLYAEAVWGTEPVRSAARDALTMLHDLGLDVTEPEFAKRGIEVELPEFGTVGLSMLGFPECLVVPPYEGQATRWLDRLPALRRRVGRRGDRWFDDVVKAVGAFRLDGELPQDELLREVVLADAELVCLLRHHLGRDVEDLMAALAAVVAATGDERKAPIAVLQQLVREGRLRPLGA